MGIVLNKQVLFLGLLFLSACGGKQAPDIVLSETVLVPKSILMQPAFSE